jgi:hypothetical protein
MTIAAPTVDDLRRTAVVFNGYSNVDRSWWALAAATAPAMDLADPAHRTILLRWLNSWGCRIRYPREGEPSLFDTGVADWWQAFGHSLPSADLERLTDAEIGALADAYAGMAGIAVAPPPRGRTLGPTAAAKALYALRPRTVMPWDAAIAAQLYGGRDRDAFDRHLRQGRAWAATVRAEWGGDAGDLPTAIGRPGISLAKILDEYCYVSVTRHGRA